MKNQLQFRISSGLKNIIGRDLITDDFIAIFELVKNSYDAHASKVLIEFENLESPFAIIRITDNGKGMNYDDLINKWLFVAYSAKKDGTEDNNFRNKIKTKSFYAGAKGIGRFSCDKLGSKLKLITKKDEIFSKIEQIEVDWDNFEKDSKDEFINISVIHSTLNSIPFQYSSGTIIEITSIRDDSEWNYGKIIRLKNSLSKLINPFEKNEERIFEIEIKANQYYELDSKYQTEYQKINGLVQNNLISILNEKTFKIVSRISKNGQLIISDITNNGTWLFTVTENNLSFNHLRDIYIELYFLNRSAKNNFTRTMGIKNTEYGSIFLYKNGIRVYPYGEPGEDPFDLDRRQQKRIGDKLGTRELIGRIEISGDNEDFTETTSRDGGLIKNHAYYQLIDYFTSVIEKLESFWTSMYKYGVDIDDYSENDEVEIKIIKSLLKIKSDNSYVVINFNTDFISIITDSQEKDQNALVLIKSIEKIARNSNNKALFSKISKIRRTLDDALSLALNAEEALKIKNKELKEQENQNLFLKSLKSQDFSELVSLMHHIGISSGIISNHLQILTYKIEKKISFNDDDLKRAISILNLENQKILSISRFATKANFKLNAENQSLDLIQFVTQYINNVVLAYLNGIDIRILVPDGMAFITTFKPLELTMIIDNLINNSKKAKATLIEIEILKINSKLLIYFKDNGVGIPQANRQKIFDFGFTTTEGSGLGLTHIRETLEKIGAKIELNIDSELNTTFLLTFK